MFHSTAFSFYKWIHSNFYSFSIPTAMPFPYVPSACSVSTASHPHSPHISTSLYSPLKNSFQKYLRLSAPFKISHRVATRWCCQNTALYMHPFLTSQRLNQMLQSQLLTLCLKCICHRKTFFGSKTLAEIQLRNTVQFILLPSISQKKAEELSESC